MSNTLNYLRQNPPIGYGVITAFYFFGIVGILSPAREWFIEKTAFNLFLSLLVLTAYQNNQVLKYVGGLAFCYLVGFTAEYLGVNFGLIFGEYDYPATLGPQFEGVPLIIGVNWFILTFCFWSVLSRWSLNPFIKIILASLLTVMLDYLIEPVAIKLDFWNWPNDVVPLQNYIGWFMISFIIYLFFHLVKMPKDNSQTTYLLVWQFLFFAILSFFLKA